MKSFSESYLNSSLDKIKELHPGLSDIESRERLENEIEGYIEIDDLVRMKNRSEIGIVAGKNGDICIVDYGESSRELASKDLVKLSADDILKDNVFMRNTKI